MSNYFVFSVFLNCSILKCVEYDVDTFIKLLHRRLVGSGNSYAAGQFSKQFGIHVPLQPLIQHYMKRQNAKVHGYPTARPNQESTIILIGDQSSRFSLYSEKTIKGSVAKDTFYTFVARFDNSKHADYLKQLTKVIATCNVVKFRNTYISLYSITFFIRIGIFTN